MTVLAPQYKWIDGDGMAFGAPGLSPRWTSSAKDAVGTAYSASSRAWYTVSHGILTMTDSQAVGPSGKTPLAAPPGQRVRAPALAGLGSVNRRNGIPSRILRMVSALVARERPAHPARAAE